MSTRAYRTTVVLGMFAWFLLGMHVPVLHEITAHGRAPRPSVVAAVALLAGCALAALWTLLRTARRAGA
jgi:hypothetical protein